MDVPHRGTNLHSRFFFRFLRPSHESPYRFEDPSCAFGAALLQGPTRWALSNIDFHSASGIHPPPSARPFSKGLLAGHCPTLAFTPLRESILRLWRGPSPRTYSPEIISHGLSYRRRLTICLLFSQSLRRCAGGLLRGRFWAPSGGCISLWRCSGRNGRCRPLWVCRRWERSLCRRL